MDSVAIGLSFQISEAVGIAVIMVVVAHRFCDGISTISLMLVHRNSPFRALTMLVVVALAPVLGAASKLVFQVSSFFLLLYFGFFAGILLHICAADILPKARAQAGTAAPTLLMAFTCLGAAFIFVAVQMGDGY